MFSPLNFLCYCDEAFMLYDNLAYCKTQTFQEKAFLYHSLKSATNELLKMI